MTEQTARDYDAPCMQAAIQESRLAYKQGHMPFGAVLVDKNGTILARGQNCCKAVNTRGGGGGDATRHAEMELCRVIPDDCVRSECSVYTSTEPCVMCAGALYWSGVGRIVYACPALLLEQELEKFGGFDIDLRELYKMGRPGTREIEIHGPLMDQDALKVHKESGVWN
jgi:tRNA(Arg) A34 adenosine deaminase TadA